jgi:hypothetical protein
MLTPLLTISEPMRFTRCRARKGCCWPEPHNSGNEMGASRCGVGPEAALVSDAGALAA